MKNNLEIESKVLLSEEQYLILLKVFSSKKYVQTNYYFDTPNFSLKHHGFSLRIRQKSNHSEITIKQKLNKGRKEINFDITGKDIIYFVNNSSFLEPYLVGIIPENIFKNQLKCMGSLTTERIDMPFNNGLLSLDKNYYNGRIDYEIEFEYFSYEKAVSLLLTFLQNYGITAEISSISKMQRALKY